MSAVVRVAALVLIGLSFLGAQSQSSPALLEELLAELGPKHDLIYTELVLSPDLRRVAWQDRNDRQSAIFVNGQPGPAFDAVGHPSWSIDGTRIAYSAKRGKRWVIVVDGAPVGLEYENVDQPRFLPDGRIVALVSRTSKEHVLLVDGQESGPPALEAAGPVWSLLSRDEGIADAATGRNALALFAKRIAYAARLADGWHIVVDGEAGPAYPDIVRVPRPMSTWTARLKRQFPIFEVPLVPRVGFSFLDASHLAYVARRKKQLAVIDGAEGPEFDRIERLQFSPKGDRSAYVGVNVNGNKAVGRVVVDGRPGPPSEDSSARPETSLGGVTSPDFDSDGSRVVYAAHRSRDEVVVLVNGKELPGLVLRDVQTGPFFGPKGRLALVGAAGAGNEQKIVEVRDGKIVRSFPLERGTNFAEELRFSHDGERLAYVVGRGGITFGMGSTERARRHVVLDGLEGAVYDAESLDEIQFSPDDRRLAYRVDRIKGGKSFVVFDGQEGKPYDEILAGTLRFEQETAVAYVARGGRRILRVIQRLQ